MSEQEKWYFSFGQDHTHRLNINGLGVTVDCDCLLEIIGTAGQTRAKMFELCGPKWAMQYKEADERRLSYFPRGVVATVDATDMVDE